MFRLLSAVGSWFENKVEDPRLARLNINPKKMVQAQSVVNKIGKSLNQIQETVSLKASVLQNKMNPTKSKTKDELSHEESLYILFTTKISDGFANSDPKDIAHVVNYCVAKAETGKVSSKEKKQFIALFDQLGKLPVAKFDAPYLLGYKEKIQRILSPELDKLLKAQDKKPALKNDEQHLLSVDLARIDLAQRMGVSFKDAGGCNGAKFAKSLEGTVGVFKASPDDSWDISRMAKGIFGQARLLNRGAAIFESFAEVAMYSFSTIFKFNVSPAAKMVKIGNKEGAFVSFLGDYKELKEVRKSLDNRASYGKEELIKLQIALIAIFASLNFDPHDENIFVKLDENGKIIDIKVIDAGNNFAKSLPGQFGNKGHRAEPGTLKIANEKFEPETLEFIRNNLTEEKFDEFVREISVKGQELGYKEFWTAEMDNLHRRTFEVLKSVLSGKIETPRQLLNILTEADYAKYVSTKTAPVSKDLRDEIDLNSSMLSSWMF